MSHPDIRLLNQVKHVEQGAKYMIGPLRTDKRDQVMPQGPTYR